MSEEKELKDGPDGFYSKYEPKEILGKGLSSVVRRCVDKNDGRNYAVKIIDVSDSSQIDEDGLDLRHKCALVQGGG